MFYIPPPLTVLYHSDWCRGVSLHVGLGLSLNLPPVGPESAPVPNEQCKACPKAWPKTTPKQQSCQPMSQCTKT